MRGAGSAPRDACLSIRSVLLVVVVCLAGLSFPTAAAASSTVVDFSEHGQGAFDQSFFSGVKFTEGSWVGYVQGDEALIGPAAASIHKKFTSVSASFAPTTQGTAIYTLTVYKGKSALGSSSMTVTQDSGDPETGPFGYATISLNGLAKRADSFRLSNRFVRSSYPNITLIDFGTASITVSG
jgi:hypothetical protein